MICVYLASVFVFLHIICDINYIVRTFFTVFSSRIYQRKCSLKETTSIYGINSFLDCNISFNNIRIARLLRELDFARYHFYDRTEIYRRSRELKIKSLQGCTLTVTADRIPLFRPYKIDTKLVYWDDRSLFLEHKVITIFDGQVRCLLLSRQHAIGLHGDSSEALLAGLPGFHGRPACLEYITHWLRSMQITSSKLKTV